MLEKVDVYFIVATIVILCLLYMIFAIQEIKKSCETNIGEIKEILDKVQKNHTDVKGEIDAIKSEHEKIGQKISNQAAQQTAVSTFSSSADGYSKFAGYGALGENFSGSLY